MSINYDNWGRLVEVVLRREKDREVALADSRGSSFSSTYSRFRSGTDSSFHEQNSLADSRELSIRSISSSSRFRPDSSFHKQNPQLEAYNSNTVNLLGDKKLFWPRARVVIRKLLNLTANNSDYSADTDSDSEPDSESESDSKSCLGLVLSYKEGPLSDIGLDRGHTVHRGILAVF
ncbi:uncharacterized protein LOC111371983 [Olea europaea var. sylvestris]|uniref:uncharacterized protein LOC111371983 n=1 Tax=Olea europaea var. sylvestris TaxID=158386 RepID=UPI000C1CD8CC|nr:uncharacterized protein LOC111371983 [Olea europaea var. sylvestris]